MSGSSELLWPGWDTQYGFSEVLENVLEDN